MLKKSVTAIALIAAIAAPFAAQAVTIDLRHEMKDTDGTAQRDRLLVSHRFENGFGFSTEAKFKSGSNESQAFNDIASNGTEIGASYLFKFDNPFTVETGLALDSNSTQTTYKPYVRAGYKLTKDLNTTVRYRPYYTRIANGAGEDIKGNQYTWAVNYNINNVLSIANEFDYKKQETDNGKPLANGRYDCWENDVKLTYKVDQNWRPYVAVANVPGSATTNERQTRYRVGLQYVF